MYGRDGREGAAEYPRSRGFFGVSADITRSVTGKRYLLMIRYVKEIRGSQVIITLLNTGIDTASPDGGARINGGESVTRHFECYIEVGKISRDRANTEVFNFEQAADQWYVRKQSPTLIKLIQKVFGYRGTVHAYEQGQIK